MVFPKVNRRGVFAEFVGTTLFVWCGCGAAVAANYVNSGILNGGAVVGISLGFGLAISSLAYAIGHISGGHMNPAVTFAFAVLRLQCPFECIVYAIAQCLGSTLGALLLWGCFSGLTADCDDEAITEGVCMSSARGDAGDGFGPAYGLGANALASGVGQGNAFILETVGTLLLVFTVLHSAVDAQSKASNAAPIAIGWAVLLAHLVLVPFTGCGINPARTFGPLLVNSMADHDRWQKESWVYFIAPFFGSAIAALLYTFVFSVKEDEEEKQEEKIGDDGDLEVKKIGTAPTEEDIVVEAAAIEGA